LEDSTEDKTHTHALDSQGFHKISNEIHRVGVSTTRTPKQRDTGSEQVLIFSPEGRSRARAQVRGTNQSRQQELAAGEGEEDVIARHRKEKRAARLEKKTDAWARARAERIF
jgi:hypothetical protein